MTGAFCTFRHSALMTIVAAGFCLHAPAAGPAVELPRATVHVKVFTCFGAPIAEAEVRLVSEDGKQQITSHLEEHILKNVPYGYYTLTAWDTGGGVSRRAVVVNAAEVWISAGLSFPLGDRDSPPGGLTITGRVDPPPRKDSWWLKVQGVFLDIQHEAPIQKNGAFTVGGLEMGAYTLQVFERSRLRHTATIELSGKTSDTRIILSLADANSRQVIP